jgi:hypothetical protein
MKGASPKGGEMFVVSPFRKGEITGDLTLTSFGEKQILPNPPFQKEGVNDE